MVSRGDIWYVGSLFSEGSMQKGARYVLVLSNNLCNTSNSYVTCVPLTSKMKRLDIPTHVVIDGNKINGLTRNQSLALCEGVAPVAKERLKEKVGVLYGRDIERIELGVKKQLGMVELWS